MKILPWGYVVLVLIVLASECQYIHNARFALSDINIGPGGHISI